MRARRTFSNEFKRQVTSEEAYVRLLTSYLIESSVDWAKSRSCIQAEMIELCRAKLESVA